MAATYREKSFAAATGTSINGTLPSGSVSGDILVAAFGSDNGGAYAFGTAPTGWTLLESDSQGSGDSNLAVYIREYDAGPWTFQLGGSANLRVAVVAISGAALAYDSAVTKSSGNATSHTLPAVSPSKEALMLSFIQTTATATFNAWSGSLSEALDSNNMGAAYESLSSAGSSGTRTVTSSNSEKSVTISVAVDALGNNAGLLLASL